ncbi:MAG: hypothetical protein O2819_02565 [Planctomycetota bacterium]|nr:hypothetical protein [Planctomycetota bacterium]MDA1105797.1 hypothetical protein [Planctomycetota bacterium]
MAHHGTASVERLADDARRAMSLAGALRLARRVLPVVGFSLLGLALLSRVLSHWVEGSASPAVSGAVMATAGVAMFTALAIGRRRSRVSRLVAAAEVDERLKLDSRLSSALALAGSDDPFARAAVADGVSCAGDPTLRSRVKRAFDEPWMLPSKVGAASFVVGCLVLFFVPAWTPAPAAPTIDPALLAEVREASEAEVTAITEAIDANEDLAKLMEGEGAQFAQDAMDGARTPEDIRREASRRITEMSQRLESLLKGEQAQELAALERATASLPIPDDASVKPLAEALKRGDFAKAAEELRKLEQAAASGDMDAQARERMQEQLEQLAKALENAAQRQQGLRDALASAGLDPDLASNPGALRQAMEAAKGLTQAQRQALQNAVNAQAKASDAAQKMASECRGACDNPGAGEGAASGAGSGKGAMDEFAKLDEMLAAARDAQGQCQGGSPTALAGLGASQGQVGPGMQGPGIGAGGEADKTSTATGLRTRKVKVENRGGEVIARQLIDNPNPEAGQVSSVLSDVTREVERGAEGATPEDPIPPHLRDAHQRYFGELKRKLEEKARKAGDS